MNVIYRNTPITSESSESTLLGLARNGGAPFEQPSFEDFKKIVDAINNRNIEIHIPWFWNHVSTRTFSECHSEKLDIDALYHVVLETEKRCKGRALHWLEKVNLFHLYGLCRVSGVQAPPESIIRGGEKEVSFAFSSLSASNSMLIQRGADAGDAITSINIIQESGVHLAFAEYQLYYYGGPVELLNVLTSYVDTNKASVIPTTIYALNSVFQFSRELWEKLNDDVISRLPYKARILLGGENALSS